MEKREKPLFAEEQLELGQEIAEADEDYKVYMARIDNIGYDATDRITVSEQVAAYPPQVFEAISQFDHLSGWL